MGIRAGSGSGGEAYGAMARVRERLGDIRGHDQGQGAVGRHKPAAASIGLSLSTVGLVTSLSDLINA